MKTKAAAAAVAEDEDEPRKIRSSRSKRRHTHRASTDSESPPHKRSKKSNKRTADKKNKRSKVSSSSRRRRHSSSASPSISSSSPSLVSRSCSTCSSSSERSVSPLPRSRSRDVKKRKGRGRDRERDPKRRKARRSTSSSSRSSSRSKSSKWVTKYGAKRDKIVKDYGNITDCFDREEEAIVDKKGRHETERYEKNVSLEKIENSPSNNANETEDVLPSVAGGGSPVAEDLELILRQKALENFMKFRAAAAMAGKTDNGATRKEALTDSPQNAGMRVTEARSAAVTPFRRHGSSLGARHPTESPKSEDCGNGTSLWMQNSSAGMSHGAGSTSRILKESDTDRSAQQEGSIPEATHSTFQPRSSQDGSSRRSVMQRLLNTPGSSSSVNMRLGSSAGLSRVNGAPRIKSVVSIPSREGLDGCTTPQKPCESSAPVENSGEIRYTPVESSKAEGTNGNDRKTGEPSASNGSILSSADGKGQVTESRIEDKDGVSQLQKKTFCRMHDGETVEVSYKVYIPKKTPALARRKVQR